MKKKKPAQKRNSPENKNLNITEGDWTCLFLATALGISGLFAALDLLPFWLTLGLLAVATWAQLKLKNSAPIELQLKAHWMEPQRLWIYFGICFALALPLAFALIRKWGDEFPFEGDYDHHVYAGLAGLQFWKSAVGWLIAAVVAGVIAFKMNFRLWSLTPLVVLVIAGYWINPPDYYFARYPAGAYFVAWPWLSLSQVFEWNATINAMRLGNASSVATWLFVLRPIFIRRPLTPGFLVFAIFLLLQRDVLLFFSSPYIEPWSLVLIFTGLEIYFQNSQKYLSALFFIGLATMFKEQSVFVLPFIWAAEVWQNHRRDFWRTTIPTVAAGLPFVVYYFYRKQNNIWRQVEFSSFEQAFASERMAQGLERLSLQFTYTGLVLPLLGLTILYLIARSRSRTHVIAMVSLLGAAVFQFLFLFMDQLTLELPMYSRFYFLAFGLIAMTAFLLPEENKWSKPQLGLIVVSLVAMSGSLLSGLQLLKSESFYRNSLDVPRAPEHYPIRSLVQLAERDGGLKKGDSIFINHPKERFIVQSMQLGYRDIVTKYSIKTNPQSFTSPACDCRQIPAHIMLPRFFHAGLLPVPEVPKERINLELQCLEALKTTCKKVYEHKLENGFVVGALGVR